MTSHDEVEKGVNMSTRLLGCQCTSNRGFLIASAGASSLGLLGAGHETNRHTHTQHIITSVH